MNRDKIAIFPSHGIGDALLSTILAYQHAKRGYKVTIYHNQLQQLENLFPSIEIKALLPIDKLGQLLSPFAKVFVQYDHTEKVKVLFTLRKEKFFTNLSVIYPSDQREKASFSKEDHLFDPSISMAKTMALLAKDLLSLQALSKETGIQIPSCYTHQKYKRVLLHSQSSDPKKNWPLEKYVKLAQQLQKRGYEISFIFSPEEKTLLQNKVSKSFSIPDFLSLEDLATFTYESSFFIGNDSGPAHMASLLNIPTIIIADDWKRMKLWKPDWLQSKVLTPYQWIPNLKNLRLRKNFWQNWISTRKVFSTFTKAYERQSHIKN